MTTNPVTDSPQAVSPVFAANWKMYKSPSETRQFVQEFAALHPPRTDATVVIFPPSISIPAFSLAAQDRPDLHFGIQDVHVETEGAHTGAISAGMVPETGATWGLAGHSERRAEFGDSDSLVAQKMLRLVEVGLRPVLCVGETLEEREQGQLRAVLERQIRGGLQALAEGALAAVTYAYEPVWAIGTGRTASPEDAAEAHSMIRDCLRSIPGADSGGVILYGGSVKPGNIEALLAVSDVDGVLVGGASLDPGSWAAICGAAK